MKKFKTYAAVAFVGLVAFSNTAVATEQGNALFPNGVHVNGLFPNGLFPNGLFPNGTNVSGVVQAGSLQGFKLISID
jgi:hypothetical protein